MVVSLVVGLLIGGIASTGENGQTASLALYVLFLIPLIYAGLSIQIKRWHDIGVSGWILLLAVVPFVGLLYALVAIVYLGFIKGTMGSNKYGPDPLQSSAAPQLAIPRAPSHPFTFSCPHCEQHISATSDDAGTGVLCPNCQNEITVPSPNA